MQILKRKWTHMCLENKLLPVCCHLGDISSLSSLFFSRPFERVPWIRYFKTQDQRKTWGKWLTSFSGGHLHPYLRARSCGSHSQPRVMDLPPIWVSIALVIRIPSCASTASFQLQRNVITDKIFPGVLPLVLQRNVIKLMLSLSFFSPVMLAYPRSHSPFLGFSILAPSGESQRYYRLLKKVLNWVMSHQWCEGYSFPHCRLWGEAPGDDRWAWSM